MVPAIEDIYCVYVESLQQYAACQVTGLKETGSKGSRQLAAILQLEYGGQSQGLKDKRLNPCRNQPFILFVSILNHFTVLQQLFHNTHNPWIASEKTNLYRSLLSHRVSTKWSWCLLCNLGDPHRCSTILTVRRQIRIYLYLGSTP